MTVSRLEDDALDPGIRQRVGGSEPGDPSTDDDDPPERSGEIAGNLRAASVVVNGFHGKSETLGGRGPEP
jgi:hypothetical protein